MDSPPLDRLVTDVCACFAAGVAAVQAPALLDAHADRLAEALSGRDTAAVLGVGKAAMAMAGALEARFPDLRFVGEATVPHGYPDAFPEALPHPAQIRVRTAGHPTPDAASEAAGRAALVRGEALRPEDLLIVLISGGGSALWTTPRPGLTLDDLAEATRRLLASGHPIQTVNAVRKRLSAVAGGRLAAAAHPARVVALVLSDVVGDPLASIASGPTVADDRDRALDADLLDRLPDAVRRALADPDSAPLRSGDPRLATTSTHLVGSNRVALEAAAAHARSLGYAVEIVPESITGEARDVGAAHARTLRAGPPRAVLWGGEPTVTLTGDGRGGRNQEAALAAALVLDGTERPAVLLCGGTDGIDGPTDAAGGWATPQTVAQATALGFDARDHLRRNDAHPLLDATGSLLRTGPTHTNVMDLHIGLVAGPNGGRASEDERA